MPFNNVTPFSDKKIEINLDMVEKTQKWLFGTISSYYNYLSHSHLINRKYVNGKFKKEYRDYHNKFDIIKSESYWGDYHKLNKNYAAELHPAIQEATKKTFLSGAYYSSIYKMLYEMATIYYPLNLFITVGYFDILLAPVNKSYFKEFIYYLNKSEEEFQQYYMKMENIFKNIPMKNTKVIVDNDIVFDFDITEDLTGYTKPHPSFAVGSIQKMAKKIYPELIKMYQIIDKKLYPTEESKMGRNIYLHYSGNKGFHIIVTDYLNQITKSKLIKIVQYINDNYEFKYYDSQVTMRANLIRLVHSINNKGGQVCEPVSFNKILQYNPDKSFYKTHFSKGKDALIYIYNSDTDVKKNMNKKNDVPYNHCRVMRWDRVDKYYKYNTYHVDMATALALVSQRKAHIIDAKGFNFEA